MRRIKPIRRKLSKTNWRRFLHNDDEVTIHGNVIKISSIVYFDSDEVQIIDQDGIQWLCDIREIK